MAKAVLYQGKTGTGKSQSYLPCPELNIKGLNPKETFALQCAGTKELPVRGADEMYKEKSKDNPIPNLLFTSEPEMLIAAIEKINANMPHIKNIIVDDAQLLFTLETMRRAEEKGYDKWNVIGKKGFSLYLWLLDNKSKLRDDLYVWIITHTDEYEMNTSGMMVIKTKTAGQMVDSMCSIEGLFTTILHGVKKRNKNTKEIEYFIKTKPEYEQDATKTPYGMFKEMFIKNDLGYVREEMDKYYSNKQ